MSKKITRLEKETSVWKMKWEGSHKALLQMATEKQQRDAELDLAARQLNQLQKLCRTLQAERSSLITQLKNEGHVPKVEGIFPNCKVFHILTQILCYLHFQLELQKTLPQIRLK